MICRPESVMYHLRVGIEHWHAWCNFYAQKSKDVKDLHLIEEIWTQETESRGLKHQELCDESKKVQAIFFSNLRFLFQWHYWIYEKEK